MIACSQHNTNTDELAPGWRIPWETLMPARKTSSPRARPIAKKTPAADLGRPPSQLIDQRIAELQDWRGPLLARLREVIRSADSSIEEEWKWNVPVWSCNGIICTGEAYKKAVKLTFAKGASLPDPTGLFNSSLDGNTRRAIDFGEGALVDAKSLINVVRAAVALNGGGGGKRKGAA